MPVVETPQSSCLAGVARRDITPPVGIYHRMWGAATHDRSTGVHRELTATAIVFQDPAAKDGAQSGARQILVALDHCILWADEMRQLIERVSRRAGVPAEQLQITFSHTHGAGLMGLERRNLPGGDLIAPYLEQLAGLVADMVSEAIAQLARTQIVYGTGRCNLAQNRDFWDEPAAQWVCGLNPGGPADDTVLVARLADEDGRTIASVVNYACHPTTLAWDNTLISPDFVGAMRELVEQATGAPCLFLQGASGDLGPRDGFVGDVAVADRNGRQLGYAALSAWESLPPPGTQLEYTGAVISGAVIGTWAHTAIDQQSRDRQSRWRSRAWTIDLAYRDGLPTLDETKAQLARWNSEEAAARGAGQLDRARDCRAEAERMRRQIVRLNGLPPGGEFPLPVAIWQTGDAIWLTLESEPFHVLQRTLRERFAPLPIFIGTLTNGTRPTYLPPRRVYGTGLYQESVALLAPGTLETLIESIAQQIDTWRTEDAGAAAGRG